MTRKRIAPITQGDITVGVKKVIYLKTIALQNAWVSYILYPDVTRANSIINFRVALAIGRSLLFQSELSVCSLADCFRRTLMNH